MIKDDLNKLQNLRKDLKRISTEAANIEKEILFKFKQKPRYWLFMQRNGAKKFPKDGFNDGRQNWNIFFENEKAQIYVEDYFRGEFQDSYETRWMSVDKLASFIENDSSNYFQDVLDRYDKFLNYLKQKEKDIEMSKRRKLYEELKKEFEV